MFSPETIWRMNNPDGTAAGLYCEHCLEPMQGFYLITRASLPDLKICHTCKFERSLEVCQNCDAVGEDTASWGGWCHDCDNQFSPETEEE
jgi:hypothetical protein